MKKPKNRNALRSIRMIEEAFLQLLSEKPLESITISQITRRAGLNRGTFYAHFEGLDDLMHTTMCAVSERIECLVASAMDEDFTTNPDTMLRRIGGYLIENRIMLERLIASRQLEPFYQDLRERLRTAISERLAQEFPYQNARALMSADYISGGVINAVILWSRGDSGLSEEQFYNMLSMLVNSTTRLLVDAKQARLAAEKGVSH